MKQNMPFRFVFAKVYAITVPNVLYRKALAIQVPSILAVVP